MLTVATTMNDHCLVLFFVVLEQSELPKSLHIEYETAQIILVTFELNLLDFIPSRNRLV